MRFFCRCSVLLLAGAAILAGADALSGAIPDVRDDLGPTTGAGSTNSEFIVSRWTSGDGLPGNEILDVKETPDGYLWLGTFQGLARFDGVRFQNFLNTPSGLRYGTRIDPLTVDAKGRLWLAPDQVGLMYLENGTFHEVLTNEEALTVRIENMCADATNGIWFVDAVGRLGRFNPEEKDGLQILKPRAASSARWQRDIAGNLWLVAPRRLRIYEQRHWRDIALPGTASFVATPCREGGLWVSREGKLRLATQDGAAREIAAFPWRGISRVQCMAEDGNKRLWIGTVGQGIYCFENGQFKQVVSTRSSVMCLFEDSSGSIWAGTRGGGLFRIRERQFFQVGLASGLQNEYVRSLCQDATGRMWLLTAEGGFGWWKDGEWRQLGAAQGWTGHDSLAVYPARDGSMLVSTARRGLWRWKDDKIERIQMAGQTPKESVADLLEDRKGRIWMVTDNSGLYCLENGISTNYTTQSGLPSNLTRCLAEDQSGDIFASDWEGAICKFANGNWDVIRKSSGHMDAVRAMVVENGIVWLGTSAGGLLRFHDGKTERLTMEQGLPDNSIRQLLFDGQGFLWAVTPHRLFRISVERLSAALDGREKRIEPVVYGRSDGLPDTSFASWCDPRCWRTHDGELWLATANGAIHFRPAALPERKIPEVLVEEILLDGKPVQPDVLEKLRPGTHRLKFVFTAPCLTAPERVRFRYCLTGVDDDWVDAGPERTVSYASLPAGHHEFRVIASSPTGAWGERPVRIGISVHPFFWQTKWFLALVVALAASSGALLIRLATVRRLKRRLEELNRRHAMERERARIARDIHDELGANLTSIGLLADMGRRHKLDPTAVSKDFNQISETARESVIAMDAIVWAINPRNDSLDHFANYIAQFAREFFGPTQIRTRLDLPTDLPAVPLPAETRHQMFLLVKEAFNNVVKHARASEVHFNLACDEHALKITITDNGAGFDLEASSSGNGIHNMRERIERLGGGLSVNTAAGKGTRLEFTLPLHKPALN